MMSRGGNAARGDAALYGASALFATATLLAAGIPQFREWGRIAVVPYALAAAAAMVLARRGSRLADRVTLAALLFVAAAVLPMTLETIWRSRSEPGLHAQSEVIITEEAARALIDGRNPYEATYIDGPLAARPLPTKTHFVYLPGTLAFGLPRALDGNGPLADARWWFALSFLAALWLALRRSRVEPPGRLRVVQVAAVLPTGALLMATGGDDLPVLGLMILALVLSDGRPGWAGLVAGAAAAIKQTAWPLIPFLVTASSDRPKTASGFAAVVVMAVAPFFLWNPAAFVEDTIRFPLGLGDGASAAGTNTLGSLIAHLPGGSALSVAVFAGAVAATGGWLLWRRPWPGADGAARCAAIVWLVALILAPAARFGYVVYPVNLVVWSLALKARDRGDVPESSGSVAG
jgi:hypothetical protein